MDIIQQRPNLLFLVAIRRCNILLFTLILRKPLFYTKLLRAISKRRKAYYNELTKYGIYLDYNNKVRFVWCVQVNGHDFIHRFDGPAFTLTNDTSSTEYWIYMDQIHRENGPAKIRTKIGPDTNTVVIDKYWYIMDKLHRVDGPAIEFGNSNGGIEREEWYLNDLCHREGGPAVIDSDGDKQWLVNGKFHRIGGPAVEMEGCMEWYEHGELLKNSGDE